MRILYCNKFNFRFSGTESYLFETMELMRARGHEVALFSMADPRGAETAYDRHFVSAVDFKRSRNAREKARLAVRAIYSTEARRKILGLIDDFQPDVAHVRNIYHHLTPSILWELRAQRVPVVYHMNDMKPLCPTYNMVGGSGKTCEKCAGGRFWHVVTEGCYSGERATTAVLAAEAYFHRWLGTYKRCVSVILAPSEFVKSQLIGNGWGDCDIRVLPHFQQLPLSATPHPGPDAPILYFGRLSREKGVADLILAMRSLAGIQLVIAGAGPQRTELQNLAAAHQLRNVTFVGHVAGAELEDLISKSQFTIFPSRAYETLGKSILESFAQGRPVIASDLGSRPELVDDSATGILYPAGDVQQLAAAINRLKLRPELAAAMGKAARAFVAERHSADRHISTLDEIYEELRRHSPARPRPSRRRRAVGSVSAKIAYIGGRGVIGKYSGIETYYEETGRRLAALGHELTVYCRSHFTPNAAVHNGMRLVRLPTIRSKHLETFIHTAFSSVHACFSDCQIVHYHTLGPALFSFLPRFFGKQTLVTVQGLDWKRKKWSWVARWVLRIAEWAAARFPNKTIVASRTLQQYFRFKHNFTPVYIPNGTNLRKRRLGTLLKQFGLLAGKYVLFLGRFSPEKNCDLLIDAFEAAVAEIDPDTTLVLAGGSGHTDEYARRLRQRTTDRIVFLDWLSGEAFEEVLTNAALVVLPSDLEGMSLSLLEAMGAGICVLASDTPENCEVIADCGFTFKAGDVDDLRRMLALLLNHSRLREPCGERARVRVQQNYLWERVTAEIETVYRDLMQQASSQVLAPSETARKSA